MWQFEHSAVAQAGAETIWALYQDVSTWTSWDSGLQSVTLDGPFAAGTRGLLQPQGQSKLAFELTKVEPLEGFSDITDIPDAGIRIAFTHRLEPVTGGTRITHRVEITGPNAALLGPKFGAHMTEGIPQTIEGLARLAREKEQRYGA